MMNFGNVKVVAKPLSCLMLFSLAACSGGSPADLDAAGLSFASEELQMVSGGFDAPYIDAGDLPSLGTAEFNGFISIFETDGEEDGFERTTDQVVFGAISAVSIEIDFETGDGIGFASTFREYDVTAGTTNLENPDVTDIGPIDGEIRVETRNRFDDGEGSVVAELNGGFAREDGSLTRYDILSDQGGLVAGDSLSLVLAGSDEDEGAFHPDAVAASFFLFARERAE